MVRSEYLLFIRDSLKAAHEAILDVQSYGDASSSLGRGAYGDITYRVDKVAEDAVIEVARSYFKEPEIISEESGIIDGRGIYILLDPVDGSTNARRGSGLYSTALAVAEDDKFSSIVAAGVIDHSSSRMIWGDEKSVYEDWKLVAPSDVDELSKAIISFDSKLYMLPEEKIMKLSKMMQITKYPRIYSTAALETAYIASGRIDAYICAAGKLRSFDCFPSLFLLKTAGCPFSLKEIEGSRLSTKETFAYYAACSDKLYEKLGKIIGDL